MNTSLRRLVLIVTAAVGGLFILTGCQSTPQDSSVPWARPQPWEGQMPGIGGGP